jgi:peroxiredoxin
MANLLTGDFDAVAQVSVKTLNRLLASMHQNHGNDAGLPTLPHRTVMRIGNEHPQGSASSAFPIITINIHGTAYVQIGVPTVSLVAQSPRDADMSCWIRGRYFSDEHTVALPEFIHGKVVARVHVEPETVAGVAGLRATVSTNDADITFTESGLAGDDLRHVLYATRWFLRNRVDAFLQFPPDVPLEASHLRAIHDGQGQQALAFPITLKAGALASGSLGQVFLNGSDFAIGVSKDYILSLIQPHLDALKASQPGFWIKVKYWGTANYTVTITKAEATWSSDGRIAIRIKGHAKTPAWWSPNVSFAVGQDLQVTVQFLPLDGGPVASVVPIGAPDPSASAGGPFSGIVESTAKNVLRERFEQARDAALAQAQPLIDQALAKTQILRELLLKIDHAAKLKWMTAAPGADGMTLRGGIALSPRKAPRIEFTELGDGSGYTAFDSWVPGGRVKDYTWTWWRSDGPIDFRTGGPKVTEKTFADRYVLQENLRSIQVPSPAEAHATAVSGTATAAPPYVVIKGNLASLSPWDPDSGVISLGGGQVCLNISGEHVNPVSGQMGGQMVLLYAEAVMDPQLACSFFILDIPEKPPKSWQPKPPCDLRKNVLVYTHAERETAARSELLLEAIRRAGRPDAALLLVFASRIEGERPNETQAIGVHSLTRELPQLGVVLAQRDGPWLRDLNLPKDESQPAWRLIDAAGRLVWQHDGAADQATLAAVLREHLMASPPLRARLVKTAVRAGDRVPDFVFDIAGRRIALRRFRGRPLALVFAPMDDGASSALVNRLSARVLQAEEGERTVFLVSRDLPGGPEQTQAAGRSDYIAIADPDGVIAQRYGVQVRPTVVLVDRDFRVSTVQTMLAGGVRAH